MLSFIGTILSAVPHLSVFWILKINECYDDYAVKPIIETTSNAFKITLPNINFRAEEQKALNTRKTSGFTSVTKKEE